MAQGGQTALPALKTGGDSTGRPTKDGLDYFRHDIGLMSDPKLIGARRKYGAAAIVTYLQLLVMAYRDKGYYLAYGENDRDGVIWSIKSEVLSGRYEPDAEKIAEMIDCLAAHGLFDGDLFGQGIITSHRIQEHYYFATAGRTNPEVKWELWLLTEQEMREISSRSVLLQKFVSRGENHSFASEKPQFHECESTHSKEHKKTGQDTISTLIEDEAERILGEKLNRSNRGAIAKMRSLGMTDAVIRDTAQYTAAHTQRDERGYAAYFMTILRERMKAGTLTLDDLAQRCRAQPKAAQVAPIERAAPDAPLYPGGQTVAEYEETMKRRREAFLAKLHGEEDKEENDNGKV